MSVFLDIIGSFLIGSMLAVSAMRMSAEVTGRSYERALEYGAQANAEAVCGFVADDLRKLGYGVYGPALLTADSIRVKFLADLGNDGAVDTVYYESGSTSALSDTPNPRDRFLRRKLNGSPLQEIRMGITRMRLDYFDADGDSLAMPIDTGRVRCIRVDLVVESPVSYGDVYETAALRFAVRPKNVKP